MINRQRSPSRQGRAGTISPTNSFDPAFAPTRTSRHFSPSVSPTNYATSLSSTPPEEDRTICAQEVGRRLRTLSSTKSSLEILHLPPLLSLLPTSHHQPSPPTSVSYTDSSLPSITPLSVALHRALHSLRPTTSLYATSPYAASFNWAELELEGLSELELSREREWYIVAFRSKRRRGFTEAERELLYGADREAHEEAIQVSTMLMSGPLTCAAYSNCCSPLPLDSLRRPRTL